MRATMGCVVWIVLGFGLGCQSSSEGPDSGTASSDAAGEEDRAMSERLNKYTSVRLAADLQHLEPWEREVVRHLVAAATAIERSYWMQAYGDPTELLSGASSDATRRFIEINFGPWDRLSDNEPFLSGVSEKSKGANFYPTDMTREEFENAAEEEPTLKNLYTMVRRDDENRLAAISYSDFFADDFQAASESLLKASEASELDSLKSYLRARAEALLSNDYYESDMAWMDMKDNRIDVVIGPVETYEDQLFGYKAANEAFVLIKDLDWSARLARYASLLPGLQKDLPVPDAYKSETPGVGADLNAYDVVYYAGDANAGSKAIAVNLPNDERVQLEKGTRRLQLKNAMRAKFDKILVPIADEVIAEDQRQHIDFDAFFSNVMFHEVAHGLGIKNTLDGKGSVREALKERASALEEAKADVLGLFMVTQLIDQGELEGADIRDNYVTFLASIVRSVRFGGASAHGRANLMQMNFLREKGAFDFDAATGTYSVNLAAMKGAVDELAGRILTFQGDGDYEGLGTFLDAHGSPDAALTESLDRVHRAGIPVDIVFEQGLGVLGLE